jgi:hypothetical protein
MGQIPEAHHFTRGVADTFWAVAGQLQGQKERVVAKRTDLLHDQPLQPPADSFGRLSNRGR